MPRSCARDKWGRISAAFRAGSPRKRPQQGLPLKRISSLFKVGLNSPQLDSSHSLPSSIGRAQVPGKRFSTADILADRERERVRAAAATELAAQPLPRALEPPPKPPSFYGLLPLHFLLTKHPFAFDEAP